MAISGKHASDNGGRGPSGALWGNVPFEESLIDPDKGYAVWEDFVGFNGTVTSNVGTYMGRHGWYSFEDTGGSIATLATEVGGVIRLTTDTTDNDSVTLMLGGTGGGLFKFASSGGKKLVMETRVRPGSIASRNLMIAFGEENLAVDNGQFSDAGALADEDWLGFHSLEGDATGLDSFYKKNGQTAVTVQDDIETLVAATWYKLGLIFDPAYYNVNKAIRFFVDGTEATTGVARSALDDTDFPDGEEMTLYLGVKNGTTTAVTLDVDWVRIWQAA